MDPSSTGPNLNRPELATQATISELLDLVDEKAEHHGPPVNEHLRTANLRALSPATGEENIIHIRQTPIEHSNDGATVFINVYPPGSAQLNAYTHWHFYPDDSGGTLTKGAPVSIDNSLFKEVSEGGSAESWMATISEEMHRTTKEEKEAGFSLAYEQETRDLIDLIKSSRPYEESRNGVARRLASGIIRILGGRTK